MDSPYHIIPSQIAWGVLIATSGSLVGLLALWAAWSRRHWFLRTAVVGGVLLLAVAIPAYEPMLVFLTQVIVVIAVLTIVRRRQARAQEGNSEPPGGRPRFSLSTLLLLVAVAAVASAVAARIPAEVWAAWLAVVGVGTSLASITLLATWAVLSRRRLWVRAIVLFALAPIVGLLQTWALASLPNLDMFLYLNAWSQTAANTTNAAELARMQIILRLALAWAVLHAWLMALLTLVWLMLCRLSLGAIGQQSMERDGRDEPNRTRARLVLAIFTLAMFLPPAATYWRLLSPAPKPQVVLPSPNAYDALVPASDALRSNVIDNYKTASLAVLQREMPRHAAALAQVRAALQNEFRYPMTYTSADMPTEGMIKLQQIGTALSAEGRLAEMEGRIEDAAGSHLDAMRLGNKASKGEGTLIHYFYSIRIRRFGVHGLIGLREQLTTAQAKDLIARLEALALDWRPPDETIIRDRIWSELAYGWVGRLSIAFDEVTGGSMYGPAIEASRSANRLRATELQLLIADLAVSCYRQEHGELPETLSALVPEYLTAVPNDPHGDDSLIYRVTDDEYLLYSVWRDGDDDGGRPVTRAELRSGDDHLDGDFFVDTMYEPLPSTTAQSQPAEEDAADEEPQATDE